MKVVADPEVRIFRVQFWNGPPARCGDALLTRSGRKYLVVAVREKLLKVVPIHTGKGLCGRVFRWQRTKRRRGP